MSLGPLMVDLAGTVLTAEDRELLAHPQVGGVILFSRNYEDRKQLLELCRAIHAIREPRLIVAADHEGGRVQRFRNGFSKIPNMRAIGARYDQDAESGRAAAEACGWLIGAELVACGVDLSFAPVADLDHGVSSVIGDRALHGDPEVVSRLAVALADGMRAAGMAAVAKHFPGHGAVAEDSHDELPTDLRQPRDMEGDLLPFRRLIGHGLAGVMTAHLLVPAVDDQIVSASRRWIDGVLRGRLGFAGAVFSDDLSMGAASGLGDAPTRAQAALAAGCDMILVCNDRAAAIAVTVALHDDLRPTSQLALIRMHGRPKHLGSGKIQDRAHWQASRELLEHLEPQAELDL
jgi:beta-N-acetylhexosaminidase